MKLTMFALLSVLLALSPAQAHEGHVHADEAQAAPATVAPRFAARTDAFELVGVLTGGEIWLYVDRADNNAPVDQAEIELESGAFKARAQRSAPAVYRLKAGPLANAGKHAVTISVSAGEDADLLVASFDNAPAAAAAAGPAASDPRRFWILGAALLLAAGGGGWLLRRRRN